MAQETKVTDLAGYRRCIQQMRAKWPEFSEKRRQWLVQQERHGVAAEKVAENILQDLFTMVLDWKTSELNNQHGRADLILSHLGFKRLLIEAKRPGALAWHRPAVEKALDQAQGYAEEQNVGCIGVSDGVMLFAADRVPGGRRGRLYVSLQDPNPPEALWLVSVHGVYQDVEQIPDLKGLVLSDTPQSPGEPAEPPDGELLHPKYKLPARCFAYVGSARDTATWKLPYLLADGSVDTKRLPMAIGAIVRTHRGENVDIPEQAVPNALLNLARAACRVGKFPKEGIKSSPVYRDLALALTQKGISVGEDGPAGPNIAKQAAGMPK